MEQESDTMMLAFLTIEDPRSKQRREIRVWVKYLDTLEDVLLKVGTWVTIDDWEIVQLTFRYADLPI
jgi:hypothetical protein